MITDIQGRRTHAIVADGLVALENLDHRGAAGAETNSGDGAGILIQLPVELLRDVVDFDLPRPTDDGCNTFAAGTLLPARTIGRPRRGAASASRPSPGKRGSKSSAGASCPSTPTAPVSAPPH